MRVCDCCYLGGPITTVLDASTRASNSQVNKRIWNQPENPEFCQDCFQSFTTKNWVELGKRQENSLQKLLQGYETTQKAEK